VILLICVAIEHVAVIERYSLKARIPGALFQALGVVVGGFTAWALQQGWGLIGVRGLIIPLYQWLKPVPFGFALYVLIILAVTDLLTYWRHRAEHKWFWPIHAVHHSPRELHAANDIGHPLQAVPNFLLVWLPMSLVQMPGPETPLVVGLSWGLLSVYLHSPIDFHFGPFRKVIVDNRFHRIHHSLEPRHIDHNFSVGFAFWDTIFGTSYWPAKDEWPLVGVEGINHPKTVTDYTLQPFRTMRSHRLSRDLANEDVAEVVRDTVGKSPGVHA
jgi:sterol desaturase/sphingolipid hydroxylase (fatty acid hydroxylase superfamily)